MEQKPLVCIWTITYNQVHYIKLCLDGIIKQQANFRFIAVVHDDASTDGTAEIVKEYADKYPDIIKPIFEIENQYSKNDGAIDRIFYKQVSLSGAKYIALCEGDDYWVDNLKLQKQVSFMESHPNCSLSHTNFSFFRQEEKKIYDSKYDQKIYELFNNEKRNIACEILNFNYRVVTASSMLKSKCFLEIFESSFYSEHKFLLGDIQLWCMLLQYGEIGYLSDNTTVYRVHADSACRQKTLASNSRMCLSIAEMQLYFMPHIKGAEVYYQKYVKNFKKQLFKYCLFDSNYKSFIKDKNCELSIFSRFLLNNIFIRNAIIIFWKWKRIFMPNSSTKPKGMI